MLKLIQLELKKFKIGGYIRGAFIANIVIALFICLVTWIGKSDGNVPLKDYESVWSNMEILIRGTFIVFAAVLLSRFVIDEYKNKSITVLFMYPINRKKLMIAKLFVVVIFTILSIVLSNILVAVLFYAFNSITQVIPGELTAAVLLKSSASALMNAIGASFMSLIPLYFGMRKHSTPTTIVSSLLIIMIVCSNNNGISLNSIIVIPISLAVLGAIVAYLSIRNVEHVDIIA